MQSLQFVIHDSLEIVCRHFLNCDFSNNPMFEIVFYNNGVRVHVQVLIVADFSYCKYSIQSEL